MLMFVLLLTHIYTHQLWTDTSNSSTPGMFRIWGKREEFEAEGIVEVLYNGRWGVLCGVSGHSIAEVLCEQLGYDPDDFSTRDLNSFSRSYSP